MQEAKEVASVKALNACAGGGYRAFFRCPKFSQNAGAIRRGHRAFARPAERSREMRVRSFSKN
jgi:hypothetical protein